MRCCPAGTLRWRILDRALRPPGRKAARRSIRHPLRHAGQHHPRPHPGGRRIHPRQGHGDRDQYGPADRHLSTGEQISARLVVVANGLEHRLAARARHDARGRQPVPLHHRGVRLEAGRAGQFDFPALTYYSERALTASPTSRCSRWATRCAPTSWSIARWTIRGFSECAQAGATLFAIMPKLRKITGGAEIVGPVKIRPADLYRHARLRAAGRRAGRRRLCDVMSGRRHRHQQGVYRRRAPVQCAHAALARDRGNGRRQDRGVLRRSGQARLRPTLPSTRRSACARCRSSLDCNGVSAARPGSSADWPSAKCGRRALGFRARRRCWRGRVLSPLHRSSRPLIRCRRRRCNRPNAFSSVETPLPERRGFDSLGTRSIRECRDEIFTRMLPVAFCLVAAATIHAYAQPAQDFYRGEQCA